MPRFKHSRTFVLLFGLFYLFATTSLAFADAMPAAASQGNSVPATAATVERYYPSAAQLEQRYALNDQTGMAIATAPTPSEEQSAGVNLHKYLGYTTVGLALAAGIANGDESTHHALAYSATAAAVGTVLSGYLQHGDELSSDAGLFGTPNLHALLGTLGAATMLAGTVLADSGGESSHSSVAMTGASLMFLSVINIKW